MKLIYLNNAATSHPKPPEVLAAVTQMLQEIPQDRGRSSGAGVSSETCRQRIAQLFDVSDHNRVILAPSATLALNLVIQGCLQQPGDGAICSELDHNSVLRPLAHRCRDHGAHCTVIAPQADGLLHPADIARRLNAATRLVVVTHASNVTGCVQPVEEIAHIAARENVPLLIDASQIAGAVPLSHRTLPGRVFIAAAGHKGLYGPSGTGLLIVPDGELPPLVTGGTGVHGEKPLQPDILPLKYEAGTANAAGIAGLSAGVGFVLEQGLSPLGNHRHRLVEMLRRGLAAIPGLHLSPLAQNDGRAGIVSFWRQGRAPEDLAYALRDSFGIETRAGLHCAPQRTGTGARRTRERCG